MTTGAEGGHRRHRRARWIVALFALSSCAPDTAALHESWQPWPDPAESSEPPWPDRPHVAPTVGRRFSAGPPSAHDLDLASIRTAARPAFELAARRCGHRGKQRWHVEVVVSRLGVPREVVARPIEPAPPDRRTAACIERILLELRCDPLSAERSIGKNLVIGF